MDTINENEVKTWLGTALNKHLETFSFNLTGSTEKGSGFWGDVIFVDVAGTDKEGTKKQYSLVLKCDKSSEAFRKLPSIFQEPFKREMYVYQEVFPWLQQFQREKNIDNPFDSTPKCYGVYASTSRKVIVMDNLKSSGYELNDLKNPFTRNHINLLVREYAKFHALSVALREQEPQKFEEVANITQLNILSNFFKETNYVSIISKTAYKIYNLFKDDMDTEFLNKWLDFKDKLEFIFYEMVPDVNDLHVLIHGDCWNNNFMFKFDDEEKTIVSDVKILDWQILRVSSPILDLSYFLFSGIAPRDVTDLDAILKEYYNVFCDSLSKLGSTFSRTYTFEKFFQEWKKYAKFGLAMCQLIIQASLLEKSDIPDMVKSAEKGDEIDSSSFCEIKDADGFKKRIRPIIEYACQTGLI